jgi:hypothetical protein
MTRSKHVAEAVQIGSGHALNVVRPGGRPMSCTSRQQLELHMQAPRQPLNLSFAIDLR